MAISQDIITKFEEIVGKEDCKTQDFELAAYSQGMIYTNPTRPDVLLLPETTEEVSEILKIANENIIPVVVRAGATAGPISQPDGGIVIDLGKMNKIIDWDLDNMVVTAEAGVSYYELCQEAIKRGYQMPLKPWYGNGVTVGGYINGPSMVGTRVAKYGTLNYWLFGITVVFPDGSIHHFGSGAYEGCKDFMSNPWMSMNWPVTMMCQSLGTLGIITEATLLTVPRPEATHHAVCGFDHIEDLCKAAKEIQLHGLATDIEHEDYDIYDLLGMPLPKKYEVVLAITNEGIKGEVEAKGERAMEIMKKYGGEELDPAYGHLTFDNTANFNFCTASYGQFCCAAGCASYESYPEIYHIIKEEWAEAGIKNGWSCWTCYPNWVQGWTIGGYDYEKQMNAFNRAMFRIQKRTYDIPNSYPFYFTEQFEDFSQQVKDWIDPNGIMNPGSWFMLSGAQSRMIESLPIDMADSM